MNKISLFQISLNELALAFSIVLASVSQLLLRLGARNKTKATASICNAKTFLGYALFLLVVLLMIYAMQQITLKMAIAWSSICYILIPLAAHWFLKEPLTNRMLAGTGLIMFGIIIFSL